MRSSAWLRSHGFELVGEALLNGIIQRINRVKSGKTGWYIGWKDPFEAVIAGDWRTGDRWEMKDHGEIPPAERKRREIIIKEAQQKASAERDKKNEAARLKADILLRSAKNDAHPYLDRKQIGAFGARVLNNELLIPCIDADGELWGLQKILADGTKLFLHGQRVDRTFHRIIGDRSIIYVCEGFATGASIHMATSATVYCAWSAGNLPKVAALVSLMHPGAQIAIAGDDDRFTDGNPGKKAAIEAAAASGAVLILPKFKNDEGRPTDFNDLHCREGLETVAEELKMEPKNSENVLKLIPGRPKSNKPNIGELYREVCETIMRQDDFVARYITVEPERGIRIPAIVSDDDSVQIVKVQTLATHIAQHCHGMQDPTMAFKAKQCREIADLYLGLAQPTPSEAIKIIRWSDEPGLAYRRLPWVRGDGFEPAPTWDALLSRMTNAIAFIDWVGSLFFEQSAMQQYVLLFGLGGDGKGSINRFLSRVFGKAYRSKQPPTRGDKFWSHGILGARLVTFPDCDDSSFVGSGLFKSLTGGDPIDVEAKGEMSFTARFMAKFLVIVNDRPSITSQRSDLRRIIFCEMSSSGIKFDPLFEKRLWDEGGAFLSACVSQYENKYPDHGPIITDTKDIKEWTDELEAPFHEAFAEWFALDDSDYVVPGDMLKLTQMRWKDRKTQLGFIRFLERTHDIRKRTMKDNSKGYPGIRSKTRPFGSSGRQPDGNRTATDLD